MIRSLYKGLLLPFSVLLVALGGCTSGSIPVNDEAVAQQIVENYYSMLKKGEFTQATELYKPKQRGHWEMFLQKQLKEVGPLTSHAIKSTTINTVFSGKFYIFQVGTKYGEHSADEILTLFLKVTDDDIHIASHKIDLARGR